MSEGEDKNITVQIVGQYPRGHIIDLMSHPPKSVSYKSGIIPSDLRSGVPAMHHKKAASLIAHSRIGNTFGLFLPAIKYSTSADIIFSINRFYVGNLPRVIWLERPAAPIHYEPIKLRNRITRFFIKKILEFPKTAVVCWTRACLDEFTHLFHFVNVPNISIIPPLVTPPRDFTSKEQVVRRQKTTNIKLLFVGSLFHVKGGKETILAFEKLSQESANISLTIISDQKSVGKEWMNKIMNNPRIKFIHSKINREEMWKLYNLHQILLHPTTYDSYGLVLLEAIRIGIPVISTNIYAIPEIIGTQGGIILQFPKDRQINIGYDIPQENSYSHPIADLVDNIFYTVQSLLHEDARVNLALLAWAYGESNFGEQVINNKWLDIYQKLLINV